MDERLPSRPVRIFQQGNRHGRKHPRNLRHQQLHLHHHRRLSLRTAFHCNLMDETEPRRPPIERELRPRPVSQRPVHPHHILLQRSGRFQCQQLHGASNQPGWRDMDFAEIYGKRPRQHELHLGRHRLQARRIARHRHLRGHHHLKQHRPHLSGKPLFRHPRQCVGHEQQRPERDLRQRPLRPLYSKRENLHLRYRRPSLMDAANPSHLHRADQ